MEVFNNLTYRNLIIVTDGGKKTKDELMEMCDVFLMNSRISSDEYNDLIKRINEKYSTPIK